MRLMDWLQALHDSWVRSFRKTHKRKQQSKLPRVADVLEQRITLGDSATPVAAAGLAAALSPSLGEASQPIVEQDSDSFQNPFIVLPDESEISTSNSVEPALVQEHVTSSGTLVPQTNVATEHVEILPSVLDELLETSSPAPVIPAESAAPSDELRIAPPLSSAGVRQNQLTGLGGGTHGSGAGGMTDATAAPTTTFSVMSFGDDEEEEEFEPPEAGNDFAWTGLNQEITIEVIENDESEEDFAIVSASGATKGEVTWGDEAVTYTPNSDFTSGTDTFTYVIQDKNGLTDEAEVTVTMVEVYGWSMQWQDRDDQWNSATPVTWSHEELRWQAAASLSQDITDLEFFAMDAEEFEQGTGEWFNFTGDYSPGDDWAYGDPGVGIWVIKPMISFQPDNQSEFVATMKPQDVAIAEKTTRAEITSIQWVTHDVALVAGELEDGVDDSKKFFPDAVDANGPARNKVDLFIRVTPDIDVPIYIKGFDVDDPSSNTFPLDLDYALGGNVDLEDNIPTPDAGNDDFTVAATGQATVKGNPPISSLRTTFTVNWMQPGNNYRVAVTGRGPGDLARLKPLTNNDNGEIWYDTDGSNTVDPGESIYGGDDSDEGIHVTPLLTVWRKMHVEVDHMDAPPDAYQQLMIQNQQQWDDAPQLGDLLKPDTDLLEDAFEPAFVDVVIGTPADSETPWLHNMSDISKRVGDRGSLESAEFWVAHVGSGYDPHVDVDNDPDAELWLLGLTHDGPNPFQDPGFKDISYIYKETIRDAVEEHNPNRTEGQKTIIRGEAERRVVVHEIGHQFELQHSPIDDDIMSPIDVTAFVIADANGDLPDQYGRFGDYNLSVIRSRKQP